MKKVFILMLSMIMAVVMIGSIAFADEILPEAGEDIEDIVFDELEGIEDEDLLDESIEDEYYDDAELYGDDYSYDLATVEVELSEEGEYTIDDYSTIEIPSYLVEITEDDIDNYIDSILEYATTTEQVTEGVVAEGDTVNIDFSGKLEGEEEPFEGGTAEGYDVVIGSGSFIEGFEEQIVGHEVGETFDIQVTFPEEYTEDLAGKNAVFTITVNYIQAIVKPELTDEFVQEFSAENLNEEVTSVEGLREYTKNFLYTSNLQNAMMDVLLEKVNVTSYPEEDFNLMKGYSEESLTYYSAMYASMGMDMGGNDGLAQMYGYASADDYTNDEAMYYMNMILLLSKLAEDKGIEVTDEEVDEAIEDYIESYGMTGVYTVEEFKEMSGEAWVKLITNLQVKYEKVMEALESNVVLIEDDGYYDVDAYEVEDEDLSADAE